MIKIKKKDMVRILSGKDKGKKGEVRKIVEGERVMVSGINMVVKHAKPAQNKPGGIQKKEALLHISKVALICPKCDKAIRPKISALAVGEKVRACRMCGEVIV
ncbi:MAG: 50S ribosomal protein L24 [Elusimicrobia bacterium]|nr:50S ribosomal protein L24 [Elusimicrobiota bacterium]